MPESQVDPEKLASFGRSFFMIFNRVTMYDANHPYCKQAYDEFLPIVQDNLKVHSPLVILMNQDQFFLGDDPLDSRINVIKMKGHFNKAKIQSISFYEGLTDKGIVDFIEVFTSLNNYPNALVMQEELQARGVSQIKFNQVYLKRVAADQEVIDREVLEGESSEKSAQTIKKITESPSEMLKKIITAERDSDRQVNGRGGRSGTGISRQLEAIENSLEKYLSDKREGKGDGPAIFEVADAVTNMKEELVQALEVQRSRGVFYSNEQEILDKANEITDNVVIQLIKDEYKSGEISVPRLAQILRRLVPNPQDLKRLLPKIKEALLEEGMSLSEFLSLVNELSHELQNEELSKVLLESAEEVGLDGVELIHEVKKNPKRAAELIFLAAEIQKSTGDENTLTELLVQYVERIGSKMALNIVREKNVEEEEQLRQVMSQAASQILGELKGMDIEDRIMTDVEERLKTRSASLFEAFKEEWKIPASNQEAAEGLVDMSVLQIMEQGAGENKELGDILSRVRDQAESQGLDEDDFARVLEEISKQKEKRQKEITDKLKLAGVMDSEKLMFYLEREISKSLRHNVPFSALSFTVLSARPKRKMPQEMRPQLLLEGILERMATEIRGRDVAALIEENKLIALLPMTPEDKAKLALERHIKLLNSLTVEVRGVPMAVKVVGVTTSFDAERTPDAKAFFQALSADLAELRETLKKKLVDSTPAGKKE
jgi:GGDEF domain-containing protein